MTDDFWEDGNYPDHWAHPEDRAPKKSGWQYKWLRLFAASVVPPAAKLTGIVTSTFANSDGYDVYPSTDTLAVAVGKHPNRVSADRTTLRKAGWLKLESGNHSRKVGVADRYILSIPTAVIDVPVQRERPKYQKRREGWAGLPELIEAEKDRLHWARGAKFKNAWLRDIVRSPVFTARARIVGAVIALDANASGLNTHLGIRNLRHATALSEDTVLRALQELRAAKALVRVSSGTKDGRGLRDEYLLNAPSADWLRSASIAQSMQKDVESQAAKVAVAARVPTQGYPQNR